MMLMDENEITDLVVRLTQAGMETATSAAIDNYGFPDPDRKEFDVEVRGRTLCYSYLREEVSIGVEIAIRKATTDPDGFDLTAFFTSMELAGIRAAQRHCGLIPSPDPPSAHQF